MFSTSWAVRMSLLTVATQRPSTPSSGANDWTSLLSVVVPIITALAPYLFNYLSERRAQRDWNAILRAIDVYMRWAEIGDVKSLLLLQRFINISIEKQASPKRGTGTYVFGALGLIINAYLIVRSITNGKPPLAIPAFVSSILMVLMLVSTRRNLAGHEEAMNDSIAEFNDLLINEARSLRQTVSDDSAFETLEKEREMNARLANLLSPEDPFARRLYRSALDKAGSALRRDADMQVQDGSEQNDL